MQDENDSRKIMEIKVNNSILEEHVMSAIWVEDEFDSGDGGHRFLQSIGGHL